MARIATLLICTLTLTISSIAAGTTYAAPHRGLNVVSGLPDSDLAALADLSPDHVRYQLSSQEIDSADQATYLAWLQGQLDILAARLPLFDSLGIKVLVDLHSPPGGLVANTAPAQQRLFQDATVQETFVQAWGLIANRFKDDARIWGFELLNEPAYKKVAPGVKDWNALASEVSTNIRKVDSMHTLVIDVRYGNPDLISSLKLPKVPNIMVSPHMYYPLNFIHQGVYGIPIKYEYPKKKFNKAALAHHLQKLKSFQAKNKNVPAYIGEFTVVRWAPKGSAYRYIRDCIKIFEKNKWGWAYHAWRGGDVFSLEHSSVQDEKFPVLQQTDRYLLLKSYFSKS